MPRLGNRFTGLTSAILAVVVAAPTFAEAQVHRPVEPQLLVSYPSDAAMDCPALLAEIARMDKLMRRTSGSAQGAQNAANVTNAAVGVGLTAAATTGVLSQVPGLGMFANAAGIAARRNAANAARRSAEQTQVAQQRQSLMTGIYQGRGCAAEPAEPLRAAIETVPAVVSVDTAPEPTPAPAPR